MPEESESLRAAKEELKHRFQELKALVNSVEDEPDDRVSRRILDSADRFQEAFEWRRYAVGAEPWETRGIGHMPTRWRPTNA